MPPGSMARCCASTAESSNLAAVPLVADRVRAEMFRRIGLEDLLHPVVRERKGRLD